MNKPLFALFALLTFFFSCSSDNDTPPDNTDDTTQGTDDTTDDTSDDTTDDTTGDSPDFLFAIEVQDNVFGAADSGKIFASDSDGNILAQADLGNNSTATLEVVNPPSSYDISVLIDETFSTGQRSVRLRTFKDANPITVTLNGGTSLNADNEEIELNLFNAGFPLEVIAPTSAVINSSTSNGGSSQIRSSLQSAPGDFFGLFLSPDDALPRYTLLSDVDGTSNIELDYTTLNFAENENIYSFPSLDGLRIRLDGVRPYSGQTVVHPLFSEIYSPPVATETLFSPDGIFDSFILKVQLTASGKTFINTRFGALESATFVFPDLDFSTTATSLNSFEMSTTGTYDYYRTEFVEFISETSTFINYGIIGTASDNVSLSGDVLYDAIFEDDATINSSGINYSRTYLLLNSSESSFDESVENQINNKRVFPAGTEIIEIRK